MSIRIDWRIRLVALAAIWGTSYLLIKVALADLSPIEITIGRCASGAALLLGLVVATRGRLPRSARLWGHLFVVALVLNTAPFTLFGVAEQHVSSAVAGVANGAAPLFTVLFALVALRDERPTRRRIAGLVLGMAGVGCVLQVWDGVRADTAGVLAAVTAAACYAAGWVYLRRFVRDTGYTPVELTAGQLACATAQSGVVWLAGGAAVPAPSPGTLAAVVALGVIGTGLAFALQNGVIAEAGATAASTVTYLVPVVAVAVGIVLGGESLGWWVFAGGALVLVGAALTQGRARGTRVTRATTRHTRRRRPVLPARPT